MSPEDIIDEVHCAYFEKPILVVPKDKKCQLPECKFAASQDKTYCKIHQHNFDSWTKR